MRSTLLAVVAITAAASLAFACGGNTPEPQPPTSTPSNDAGAASSGTETPSASASPAPADAGAPAPAATDTKPAEADFDSLPKDKKVDIMMTKVVPDVGKVFKEHDGKKYAKFNCKVCHGDAKEKSKDDPKKVLPKLTFSNGGMEKLQKSKAAMFKFMSEKVVPTMANALGEKPYDPQTKQGFGCGGCHTIN